MKKKFEFPDWTYEDAANYTHAIRISRDHSFSYHGAIAEAARKFGLDEKLLEGWVHKHIMYNNAICREKYGCNWYTKLRDARYIKDNAFCCGELGQCVYGETDNLSIF